MMSCDICRKGEGCQTGKALADVFTPQVCTAVTIVCTCVTVASFLAYLYLTQMV